MKLLEVIIIQQILESRYFSKTMVELLLHIWRDFTIEFCIDYKPTL